MTVGDLSNFRQSVGKVAKRTLLVKHSLAKKIFDGQKLAGAEKFLKGQTLFTFGDKDPQETSKAIVQFAKGNDKLKPAGMIFEGKVFGSEHVKSLSALPSRHELLTHLVVRVKSPISGLVMTLSQVMRGFVVALNEVKKQKEANVQPAS